MFAVVVLVQVDEHDGWSLALGAGGHLDQVQDGLTHVREHAAHLAALLQHALLQLQQVHVLVDAHHVRTAVHLVFLAQRPFQHFGFIVLLRNTRVIF